MAVEGDLAGLFVGADHAVVYTDSGVYDTATATFSNPPADMTGWTVVLDIRKKDTSADPALLSVAGVVSGVYANTVAANAQKVTFTLTDEMLAASIFRGDDPTLRYSIKRTNAGAEQPLRFGDLPLTRVTQA